MQPASSTTYGAALIAALLFACGDGSQPANGAPDAAPGAAPDAAPDAGLGPTGKVRCLRSFSGPDTDRVEGLDVASDGSIYAAGWFRGNITLGQTGEPAGVVQLVGDGVVNTFIARFSDDCRLLWAQRVSGLGVSTALDLAAGVDGDFYVVGQFSGEATFAPGEPSEKKITAAGVSDLFIARYRADGALDWVASIGGTGPVTASGVTVSAGHVYVSGKFTGMVSVGASHLATSGRLANTAFIARYDTSGNAAWAAQLSAEPAGTSDILGVAVVGSEAVVAGHWGGKLAVGPTELTTATREGFVARYRDDGTVAWVKRFDGLPRGITVDGAGAALVTGAFGGAATATFGAGEAGQTVLSPMGTAPAPSDVFVARFDGSDGHLLHAHRAGGPMSDAGNALRSNAGGYVAVGTYGDGPSDHQGVFGPGEPNETMLVSNGFEDIFVAQYRSDGTLEWARSAGGANHELARRVAVLGNGDLVVGGSFAGTALFDGTPVGPARGASDGFLVVMRP